MKVRLLVSLIGFYLPVTFAAQNIETCEQLLDIPNRTRESYILTQDVYCNGFIQNKAIDFKGNLDGNGYRIIGLEIGYDDSSMGLFSTIYGGSVFNLGLDSIVINDSDSHSHVGLLAGSVGYDAVISDIEINTSSIRVTQGVSYGLGLLAGYVSKQSKLEGIRSDNSKIDTVDGTRYVGGLIGVLKNSSLNLANVDGNKINISYDTDGDVSVAGLIGNLIKKSVVSNVSIENSTIMAASIYKGDGAIFIGQMNQSRLVNGLSKNSYMEFSDTSVQWRPAIAVGKIHKEYESIPTLENIRASNMKNLPWYNSDSDILTKDLQIIE